MDLLSDLNERQREAATVTQGPVIVLAGAGSGKTKMLISRIAHLMREGVPASQILAVTFTNKAAGEMKHRVSALLTDLHAAHWAQPWMGFSAFTPEVSTFHSFCVKVLRQEADLLGYARPFVIYDDSDQLSVLKKILDELNIDPKSFSAKRFQGAINQAKCQAVGPDELVRGEFAGPFGEMLPQVYRRYQEVLRENCAFDFGDLIVRVVRLFQERKDVLDRYQDRFRYLMVDEYQDTNRAQYLLIRLLSEKYRNLCVVGDEDQSIYKWRGADIRNILDFQRDYPEASVVKLEQNYRSTKTIISAASAVIRNNESRYDKTLWTENGAGEKIRWVSLPEERAEAEYVTKEIQKHFSRGTPPTDVAVFYRSHAQSRALEESLRRLKVPYKIVGGVGFYERKEIKDTLAYLRVLVNPDDSVSLLRIINVPARGIGGTTIEKLEEVARERKISLWRALAVAGGEGLVGPSVVKKLQPFRQLIEQLRDTASREWVSEIFHRLLDASGYVDELKAENSEESKARIDNLQEFDTVIKFFEEEAVERGLKPGLESLGAFLGQVTLEASLLDRQEETGAVSLMTLHSSKGLEFPVVFLVGCEEGVFPSRQSVADSEWDPLEIEEERRLCYVGITRAKRQLTLTSAQVRRIYGQVQVAAPSRFIAEIPMEYLDAQTVRGEVSLADAWSRSTRYTEPARDRPERAGSGSESSTWQVKSVEAPSGGGYSMKVGQRVRHANYGVGTVRVLEGAESDRKVTIEFSDRKVKKFSLKHVELELL
ncbi:MAG: UvrD-helicase domain-containing protein [Bdellovibrionales bacterium]|nr:UvrD-helicase domain-containing protein [Bdellovibrionales bacterium]